MAWLLLIVAGLFETAWAIGLKYTQGFTRLGPTIFTITTLAISMYLLGLAARTLPMGTAYAVWVGIGAAGTALLGMMLLNEPVSFGRICFLILLLLAIMGLKWTTPDPNPAPNRSLIQQP